MTGTVPANLPAAPTFKHPEQEEEADGSFPSYARRWRAIAFRARLLHQASTEHLVGERSRSVTERAGHVRPR
jgi:hypothetical protein